LYCFYIPASEFLEVCLSYPDSQSILQRLAFKRSEYFKALIRYKTEGEAKATSILLDSESGLDNLLQRSRSRGIFNFFTGFVLIINRKEYCESST